MAIDINKIKKDRIKTIGALNGRIVDLQPTDYEDIYNILCDTLYYLYEKEIMEN